MHNYPNPKHVVTIVMPSKVYKVYLGPSGLFRCIQALNETNSIALPSVCSSFRFAAKQVSQDWANGVAREPRDYC